MFVKSSTLLSCKILSLSTGCGGMSESGGRGAAHTKKKNQRAKGRKAFNGKAINNDHKCQNIRYPSLKLYLFTFHRRTHEVTTIIFHFHPLHQDAPLEGCGAWPQNNKKHYGAKIKCSAAVKGAKGTAE